MLNYTPYMETCLSYLKESPTAASTDKKLAAWVDLQRLSEEVGNAFRCSPTGVISFQDPEIRGQVELLSQKFDLWWESTEKNILDGKREAQRAEQC